MKSEDTEAFYYTMMHTMYAKFWVRRVNCIIYINSLTDLKCSLYSEASCCV